MNIGMENFDLQHRTYIMGILNATPDSFSDGGKWNTLDAALFHAEQMIQEGADILDIGGESTRPGYTMLSEEEELQRILPILQALKQRFAVPLSIDTYKSKVAAAAIAEGVDLINDIWGLQYDPAMAETIARSKLPCCLMHNRRDILSSDIITDIREDLAESLKLAAAAGISKDHIILDPGIGFGKTHSQNLSAIARLEELHSLGCPLLLGTSRKSVIAKTLDLPVNQRVEGTLATTVFAVLKGCAFVRVHDIKENKRVIQMAEAIRDSRTE